MAGKPLSPERRAGIEAWAERNPGTPHAGALRVLLAEIDRLTSPQLLTDWNPDAECPLTSRQLQIFIDTANGHTVQETADRLGIDRKTLRKYRSLAQRKLGVRSPAQVVAVCLINGWFPTGAMQVPAIPPRLSPVKARNTYAERAQMLRQTPGEWGTVAVYDSGGTARSSAHRLRVGAFKAFRPAGAWDAEAFADNGTHGVRACYVGAGADAALKRGA